MSAEQSPKRDHRHMRTVLDTIMTVWYKYPELRLGQLLENARTAKNFWPRPDAFNIEDERLMQALRAFDDEMTSSKIVEARTSPEGIAK